MPTFAELANDRATVTYGEGNGKSLTIEYRPRKAATTKWMKLARDMDAFDANTANIDETISLSERLAHVLCGALISWDALEPDGSVVPITQERLEDEDVLTLASLYGAISNDARQSLGEPSGKPLRTPYTGTSTRKAGSTASRKGASRSK